MKQCPVLGCLGKRQGLFCGPCWHAVPKHFKAALRESVTPRRFHIAVLAVIATQQAIAIPAELVDSPEDFIVASPLSHVKHSEGMSICQPSSVVEKINIGGPDGLA